MKTILGYTFEEALSVGEQIYGDPMWNVQMVLNDLEWMWENALEEARILQGSSSKDYVKGNQLEMLREWCMTVDKMSDCPTHWYDESIRVQKDYEDEIESIWNEGIAA